MYWTLSKYETDTTETLLMTSHNSPAITSEVELDLHASLATDIELDSTDRLVLKIYANLSATPASATTVVIYQEGATNSHTTIGVASSVLSNIFVRKDLFDAKGDIITATANDTPAILSVGATDGQVLKVDSAQAKGIKWEKPKWTEVTGKLFTKEKTFYAPDFMQDILPVMYFPSVSFPYGVTVKHLSIRLPSYTNYSVLFAEKTVDGTTDNIHTVATTGGSELFKAVESGWSGNPDIAADTWIMVTIPATDVDWVSVCVVVQVDDS